MSNDMFSYSDDQVAQIQEQLNARNFPGAYRLAADFAEAGDSNSAASIAWMRGAANVNQNAGSQAQFIRQYTAGQLLARYGEALNVEEFQFISNSIARDVLGEIIREKTVPLIETIAGEDALPAATGLFKGDPGGWAGNPLFLFLGLDAELTNNVLEKPGDTYDALAMIKFAGSTGTWKQKFVDAFGPLFSTGLPTVVSGANQTNTFLKAAYGGTLTSIQVLSSQVVLGRVDTGSQLDGLSGGEFMRGGNFDDVLESSSGDDVMDGGGGRDIADFSNAAGFVLTPATGARTTRLCRP